MKNVLNDTVDRIKGVLQKSRKTEYQKAYCRDYRVRMKQVNCTLAKKDFLRVQAVAQKHGLSVTTFFREAAMAYLKQKYVVPENLNEHLHRLSVELRRIGNNLNQIARHTNRFKKVTYLNLTRSGVLLKKLEQRLVDFIRNPQRDDHKKDGS